MKMHVRFGSKPWGGSGFNAGAGKEDDAAAEGALKPIVLSWIEDKGEHNKNRHGISRSAADLRPRGTPACPLKA